MAAIIKPTTVEELKQIWFESLLNNTDRVTKIAPLSVLNGIAYGTAKIGQKTLKELALIETHLFPDLAFGEHLDRIADNSGVAPRYGATKSGVYVRVVGASGTTYQAGVHVFSGNSGVDFEIVNNFTIGDDGFGYVLVRSINTGEKSNVKPTSINRVTPIPNGHQYCVNEFMATGGRDVEADEDFRKRIKEGANVLARGTLSMLEQVFNMINNNVLKCYYHGINTNGQTVIAILTQSGEDLSNNDFSTLLLKGKKFFSLSELKPDGVNGYGISLVNVTWFPIDISVRLRLYDTVNQDDVRKEIQLNLNKYFDYRTFNKTKVEWDDLLEIVKNTAGVKYVLDNFFQPSADQYIPKNTIPRIRMFSMLNPDGSLIIDGSGNLNPVYYPSKIDVNYQKTVFKGLL